MVNLSEKYSQKHKELIKNRIRISVALFLTLIVGLIVRLGYIQVVMGPVYSEEAMSQQYKDTIIPPMRGTIYDRTGKELAVSVPKHDLWIEMTSIKDSEKDEIATKISRVLEIDKDELLTKMNDGRPRFLIERYLDSEQVKMLREEQTKGIWFEESSKRYYPYGSFASYVIGHVSNHNVGLAGVEASFDSYLRGVPGRKISITDARGREIDSIDIRHNDPINGRNIILTIDEVIQHHMERAVSKALVDNDAKRVIAIAMDPKTGDILGMVSKPDYDPNDSRTPLYPLFEQAISAAETDEDRLKEIYQMWRNPAVNDIYEPGSPFKIVTAAAAFEEGLTRPDEWFNDKGFTEVANRRIRNWRPQPFGNITFTHAMEQSVNSTFIEVAQRLGQQKFLEYITAFGFGKKTGIELPGEGLGMMYNISNMGPVELATTSFGQSISVTPIQMLSAISAIGNEGKLMKPRIVKEITDEENQIIRAVEPEMIKRAVSKQSADEVLLSMESVVANGSGGIAKIDGYRIAGKTGTAQKVVDGKYVQGYYIASFAAIAPVEDPKIAVLVLVDEPRAGSHFGSTVSGPIVKEIVYDSLRYLGVKPNAQVIDNPNIKRVAVPEIRNMSFTDGVYNLNQAGLSYFVENPTELDTSGIVLDTFPKPGEMVPLNSSVMLYISSSEDETMSMPNLIGMTFREVEELLSNMGLEFIHVGTGKAKSQLPNPGTIVRKGNSVSVEFE